MNNKSQTINNYKTVSVFNVTGGLYRRRRLLISLDAYSPFILNLLVVSVLIFVLSVMVFNQHMLPSISIFILFILGFIVWFVLPNLVFYVVFCVVFPGFYSVVCVTQSLVFCVVFCVVYRWFLV